MHKEPVLSFLNKQFMKSRESRLLRIAAEYISPYTCFEKENVKHTVLVFGSARLGENSPYYKAAEEFAYKTALLDDEIKKKTGENIYICSGGGYGIMEAANRGAARAGKKNLGFNIKLPFEEHSNQYITDELNISFHYFFMRKFWFLYLAKSVAVFPGGYGTMDELFETLTLLQTMKMEKYYSNLSVLLYNEKFWREIINFNKFIEMGLISPEDMELIHFFDDIDEGISFMKPRIIETINFVEGRLKA